MPTKFRIARGNDANIQDLDKTEGRVYFALDTGKIYYDKDSKTRITMGGSGVSVFYAKGSGVQNSDNDFYTIDKMQIEDPQASIKIDDLIICSDGAFYKVLEEYEYAFLCEQISISGVGGGSGTGGGGGSTTLRGRLTVTALGESNILNGNECQFRINVTSATEDGVPVDDEMRVSIAFFAASGVAADGSSVYSKVPYYTDFRNVGHQQQIVYDATAFLRRSTDTKIVFTISGSASNIFYSNGTAEKSVSTHAMSISWIGSQFSNMKFFTDKVGTALNFSTGARRIVDLYFDNALVYTKTYEASDSTATANIDITATSSVYNLDGSKTGETIEGLYIHGRHTVSAVMSLAKADGTRGAQTDIIKKEIALYLKEGYPLIWFGDMKEAYYEFDNPLVPIRVYDPHATANTAHVYLFIDGADVLDGSYREVSNDANTYEYWALTDLKAGQTATYQVRVGVDEFETWEMIPEFEVLPDTRNMGIVQSSLKVNIDTRSRSNSESAKRRAVLDVGGKRAEFNNFNWYNNGWVLDENKVTCLRISNGASLSLPVGAMSFAGNVPSHTVEIKLRIFNVQSYEKLITAYTRYRVKDNTEKDPWSVPTLNMNWKDDALFAEFLAQRATGFSSYDAFLTDRLPALHEADNTIPTYDDLAYSETYRDYNLNSAMLKYVANEDAPATSSGLCLGPQDGYFSNGTNAVTADYVEDKIINLTIVYDHGTGTNAQGNNCLMKFYMNGSLCSVARSTINGSWDINTPMLTINSNGCDVDLYKFRVYDKALGLDEILQNIAYDNTDTEAWDLAQLWVRDAEHDEDYQFSYNKMLDYNKNHPDNYIMPYILFTTDDTDPKTEGNLPWRKDTPVNVDMEFVNTGLDRAFATGELSKLADQAGMEVDEYYLHHCPSWIAENVTLSVQGTSSEFYPRRNYKAKTKIKVPILTEEGAEQYDEFGDLKTNTEYTMKLHKGPFADIYDAGNAKAQKYFYYDNDTVGTNKFTLKVDYMESSGSYNMGLANLVYNAYSRHPLADYNSKNAFVIGTPGTETELTVYPADRKVWYRNHKGNWKVALTGDAEFDATLGDEKGDITVTPDTFALGPMGISGAKKVLGGTKSATPAIDDIDSIRANIEANSENGSYEVLAPYINKFYAYTAGSFATTTIGHLSDYRTTVQGFPTLAFHITKSDLAANKEPKFIGRYNMLLDKGSDDVYGFTVKAKQAYVDNKDVENVAECWEFQNNSRGFCSYRDPWGRKELSFHAPDKVLNADKTAEIDNPNKLTVNKAPYVADSFEYRYHADGDFIDYLVEMKTSYDNTNTVAKLKKQYGDSVSTIEGGQEKFLELLSNWEKAVAWVWSTATDAMIDLKGDGNLVPVPRLGTYELANVGEALYQANTYYIEDGYDSHEETVEVDGEYQTTTVTTIHYSLSASNDFDPTINYYHLEGGAYKGIKLTGDPELVFIADKFYTLENKNYVLATEYNADKAYYALIESTDQLDDAWKLVSPVTYGNITYEYDTQEYRLAKFKNELTKHFSLEYLITYFVVTEVLLAYDSRGKNCMMASWGPQEAGGDYIWYPIFYDMDTQLGINNTGIPSFGYDADATEDGTFSTNDSVLWNNLYALFKNLIVEKYQQMTGVPSTSFGGSLAIPPFKSVDTIESWYSCDPAVTKSYSATGARPLLALNLDEQYKYISITNPKVGYLASDQKATLTQDTSNTYFYALQGNRAMSRQQFLTNRLNYIDSWFTVGNYKRGGANLIRSRISANKVGTSDKWIEGTATNGNAELITGSPYWTDGKKTHLFDAEYWIDMTPVRNMYVTVGTDAANFESIKYSGTPVRFTTSDLEKGVRESGNYAEQLYYIYGLDQMKSLGDLSKVYFIEFVLSGKAAKMTDLRLGYDGLDENEQEYKNAGVNAWTIPAAAGTLTGGMPLLKEVNLCNIEFKDSNLTFDFTSCEKLENFRNTGSNIASVTFAPGVALNTLYLGKDTTELNLVEARMLKNVITHYEAPVLNTITNKLEAAPGLFIEGLTDKSLTEAKTKILRFIIRGGSLGYESYYLLEKYIAACKNTSAGTERKINLTEVQWSPYIRIEDEDYVFDNDATYYVDDGHFGLTQYNNKSHNSTTWKRYINNKMLYEYDATAKTGEGIKDVALFDELVANNKLFNTSSENNEIPTVTGFVYIENETAIDEGVIQTKYADKFPGLTFFFKNVTKGYSARFVTMVDGAEMLIGIDKISVADYKANTNLFFKNPMERREGDFSPSKINSLKPTQDFIGWTTDNTRATLVETYDINWVTELGNTSVHTWDSLRITDASVMDYTFYATFEDHFYEMNYYVGEQLVKTQKVVYGKLIPDAGILPTYSDDTLGRNDVYRFICWTRDPKTLIVTNENAVTDAKPTSLTAVKNYNFYAAYIRDDVHNNVISDKFLTFTPGTYKENEGNDPWTVTNGYYISIAPGAFLTGKITLPVEHDGRPILGISKSGFQVTRGGMNEYGMKEPDSNEITHIFWAGDTSKVRRLSDSSFRYASMLQYFEVPKGLRVIGPQAFNQCSSLQIDWDDFYEAPIYELGNGAFNSALTTTTTIPAIKFNGTLRSMGTYCLSNNDGIYQNTQDGIEIIQFGGPGDPTQITTLGSNTEFAIRQNDPYPKRTKILFYTEGGQEIAAIKNALDNNRGIDNNCYTEYQFCKA